MRLRNTLLIMVILMQVQEVLGIITKLVIGVIAKATRLRIGNKRCVVFGFVMNTRLINQQVQTSLYL